MNEDKQELVNILLFICFLVQLCTMKSRKRTTFFIIYLHVRCFLYIIVISGNGDSC